MLNYLKQKIQDIKIEQREKQLEVDLLYYKDRYARWIEQNEGKAAESICKVQAADDSRSVVEGNATETSTAGVSRFTTVSFCDMEGRYPFQKWESEFILIADMDVGTLSKYACTWLEQYFDAYPEVDLVYADEDYQCGERRIAPWMKPCFSPDTLMAFQYLGHAFAVRRKAYEQIEWLAQGSADVRIYDFLLKCAEQNGKIAHLPEVLFHNRITKEELIAYEKLECDAYDIENPKEVTADENRPWHDRLYGDQARFDQIRMEAAGRSGYPAKIDVDQKGIRQLLYEIKPEADGELPLVSIVIPSKDNVEVLERCLVSIKRHAGYERYEILVVDNGSSGAARTKLMNLAERLQFRYFYQPMEFNFSVMVNYGVSQAHGSYVLLLNDDCEVLQDDWLVRMLGQAQLPHVGAVGAKLLYPDSDLIQHTGVTNLAVGPAHKLQQKSDRYSYYYGRNRMNYDYIGVTAACLLVSKAIYNQVGCFDEKIKVAFNDVDFCFALIKAGLYNVMRCDVVLYHYESLSRGNDLLSEEKMKRMLSERDKLYEKHPEFWGKDEYGSLNLLGNANDYIINYHYDYEKEDYFTQIRAIHPEIQPEWYNDSVFVTMEQCKRTQTLELRKVIEIYHISGWAYVLNQNNCRYEMSLLLEEEQTHTWYHLEVSRHWRPDVVQILPEQKNVDMAGFLARIRENELPGGSYRVYVFMKDMCSRQKLLKDTGEVLRAE